MKAKIIRLLCISICLILTSSLYSQYNLTSEIFSNGNGVSTNSQFSLRSIVGQPALGSASNDSFQLNSGFIITDINNEIRNIPTEFKLFQNYPNPFNPSTTISYQLPKQTLVIIKIYNLLGQEIKTLVNEEQNIGNYSVVFNANNLSSGVYFFRIVAGNYFDTKRMLLLK